MILPDYPVSTRWLSDDEKKLAVARLYADNVGSGGGGQDEDVGHWKSLKQAFSDWRTYVFMGLYLMATGALTINYFMPVVVRSLGYSGVMVQYMTVPICECLPPQKSGTDE